MEYEFISMQVGKKFPLTEVLEKMGKGAEGASLNYNKENQSLTLYICLPNPTKAEINAFRKDIIRFALYDNPLLDTSIIMCCFGTDFMFDLVYDINVLDIDMSGKITSNAFNTFLIDTNTGILHGIRPLGLGRNFMKKLNHICRNDGRYNSRQFNEWIQNDVYKKSLKQLWSESERIDWDK